MATISIYVQCGDAARQLLDDPGQRIVNTDAPEGLFTEMDVLALAGREADWNDDEFRLAMREASQVMGTLFRNRQAVRFGPVHVPGLDDPDYVRIASKIVYASVDGPEVVRTPNGTFPRLFIEDDTGTRQGRRLGATGRNDLKPWAELTNGNVSKPTTAEQREILELKARVATLQKRLDEAERKLREHGLAVARSAN